MISDRRNLNVVPSELPCGAHLLAVAYGTGKDDYLAVVLGFIPAEEGMREKWVTWIWNSDPGCFGFGDGHYMNLGETGWANFCERSKEFVLKAILWDEVGLLRGTGV